MLVSINFFMIQQKKEKPLPGYESTSLLFVHKICITPILLKLDSGRVEAFHDLLSTVRMRGLRGDPLLKDSEALIDQYHSMGIILENQAQVHKALDDQAETFQTNAEQTRAWIRDFKQGLETLEAETPKQMKAQVGHLTTLTMESIISCFKLV